MPKSQRRAIASRDAYLEFMRTQEVLRNATEALLRDHGLSLPQFNALRILRGGPDEGLPCAEIGNRLINRLPDVTRLVDRLEKAGYVSRARSTEDRRVVRVVLTDAGREKLAVLDDPMLEVHERQFADLKIAEIEALRATLEGVRSALLPQQA